MVNDCVRVHPFASVTVTVYVPAHRPVADAPVPPDGAHEYVYGPTPPVATTDATPVHPPLHRTLVCVGVSVMAGGAVMENVRVAVQPPEAVTVHVYVPAHNPVAEAPVPPDGAHE